MNNILLLIFLTLMIWIGGKRGLKSSITLFLSFILLIIVFYLSALGLNSIIVTLIGCLIITSITLFLVNGYNVKTKSSFISILIILVILSLIILLITDISRIGGFGKEAYEEINMFSYDINLNMTNIAVSLIIIALIGAMIDTSVAISSALYEVYENNKHLNAKELYNSGINIGKDILGTTINTLFFAFLGEYLTLLIWFNKGDYKFLDILNAKVFCAEFIKIICVAIGCILVIPVTSFITTKKILNG